MPPRNEYLAAENRILRAKINRRLLLSDGEKSTLAEVAVVASPDTILRWFRMLVACKFDGSRWRQTVGRLRSAQPSKIQWSARGEPGIGLRSQRRSAYESGPHPSDLTVGNILKRHGIAPAPRRKQTTRWCDFIPAYMDVLAGTDFFTVEVLTLTAAPELATLQSGLLVDYRAGN